MEQITAMKITGLTLNNFRNHTETTHFDFGDISYITGHSMLYTLRSFILR